MSQPSRWILADAPYAGGAEQYLEWLLQAAPAGELGLLAIAREGLLPWIDRQRSHGVPVQTLPASSWWREARALTAWARANRPASVHVNLPGPYDGVRALAPWAVRQGGAQRVVVTEHLPTVGKVGKRYFVKRLTLDAIDTAITVCETHRAFLCETFGYRPPRVVSILNGVPDPNPAGHVAARRRGRWPADLLRREGGDSVRLVQVGSLDARKGGDVLIQAACILRQRGHAFSVWLVGEGPARDEWEALAVSLRVDDQVHLIGHREDVHAILAGCDVAVLASHREGMPLSLLEASAHGLPIVATAVDGVTEVIETGRTGRLVSDGDHQALAAALEELVIDPGRRACWGTRARQRYEQRFTLPRMVSQTLALYEGNRN